MAKKQKIRITNGKANIAVTPAVLVCDVYLPPFDVAGLVIPMPCGMDEIVAALNLRGLSFSPKLQDKLVSELLIKIAPLAHNTMCILAKRNTATSPSS